MTTMHASGLSASPVAGLSTWPRAFAALPVAAGAGVLLGVGDVWWNASSLSAWATVANSCGGWAIAAFVLGAFLTLTLRTGAVTAAVAGVLMLVVAVEAYYVAEVVWLGSDPAVVTSEVAKEWVVLAVPAGSVLGFAGAWAAGRSVPLAIAGTAMGAALLLGDALQLSRVTYGGGTEEAHVLALLGLLVLVASVARPLVAVGAAVLCVPLTLVVAAGFASAGVGL